MRFKNRKTIYYIILTLLLISISFSGCLGNNKQVDEYYSPYGTILYDGGLYPIGDPETVTIENIHPNTFYGFYKNDIDGSDGY